MNNLGWVLKENITFPIWMASQTGRLLPILDESFPQVSHPRELCVLWLSHGNHILPFLQYLMGFESRLTLFLMGGNCVRTILVMCWGTWYGGQKTTYGIGSLPPSICYLNEYKSSVPEDTFSRKDFEHSDKCLYCHDSYIWIHLNIDICQNNTEILLSSSHCTGMTDMERPPNLVKLLFMREKLQIANWHCSKQHQKKI